MRQFNDDIFIVNGVIVFTTHFDDAIGTNLEEFFFFANQQIFYLWRPRSRLVPKRQT